MRREGVLCIARLLLLPVLYIGLCYSCLRDHTASCGDVHAVSPSLPSFPPLPPLPQPRPKVVPEPVDKWQNVGDGKVNLLMEFYQDPQRFAYTFQNYVFLTRMMQVGGGRRRRSLGHRYLGGLKGGG